MRETGLKLSTGILACFPLIGMKAFVVVSVAWVMLLVHHRIHNRAEKKTNSETIIALCGLYLFMCAMVLISDRIAESWKHTETAAALLVFPAALFGCAPSRRFITRDRSIAVFAICALVLGSYVNLSILSKGLNPVLSESSTYRSIFSEVSWISHPLYASYVFAIGFLFALDRSLYMKTARGWWITACVLLLLFTILCASRMPLIAITICSAYYLFRSMKTNKLLVAVATVVIIVGGSLATPSSYDRIQQLNHTSLDIPTTDDHNSVNVRVGIMYCSLKLLKDNWLLGVGAGNSSEQLTDCTNHLDHSAFSYTPVDTHDQALHYWLEYGVFGLVLFMLMISYSMIRSWQNGDHLHLAFLLLLVLCMITENLLSRQVGVVLFAFWNTVFLYTGDKRMGTTAGQDQ